MNNIRFFALGGLSENGKNDLTRFFFTDGASNKSILGKLGSCKS